MEEKLRDCFEELVKFTLSSHHLTLSTEFCFTLLKDDPADPSSSSHSHDSLEGVPAYPLYKRLALALLRCMDSESFCSTSYNLALTHENTYMQQKHNEWHKLIVESRSEIVDILKSVSLELHVQEPFFTQLKAGLKTIEGRCATSKYSRIELGNLLLLNKSVVFKVQGVRQYPTFSEMLEAESPGKVLPGVESVEEGTRL